MIAVIGAGLAGLSAAHHLNKRGLDYIVLDRRDAPGGLCRSYNKNGYSFDLAGHFLHLRTAEGKALAGKYFHGGLIEHLRKASVRTHGARMPFPFQAHLGALPPEVNLECLLGFVRAQSCAPRRLPDRFDKWALLTFGEGMAKHFFVPYNSKFWRRNLGKLLLDWTTWSVPRPNLEEVIRGSLGMPNEGMGYNPRFLYPREGGIGAVVGKFAAGIKNIHLNAAVREIYPESRMLALENGDMYHYRAIISSVPLPALVAMIRGADAAIKRAARRLAWIAIDCVQLGIGRSGVLEDHWSYIPERAYPFHRVGRYPGEGKGTRLYVEFTRRGDERFAGAKRLIDTAIRGLTKLGILKGADEVEESHVVTLDPAYVVYDRARKRDLPRILAYLKRRRILSVGRYGAWEYSAMEDAILHGWRAAESL